MAWCLFCYTRMQLKAMCFISYINVRLLFIIWCALKRSDSSIALNLIEHTKKVQKNRPKYFLTRLRCFGFINVLDLLGEHVGSVVGFLLMTQCPKKSQVCMGIANNFWMCHTQHVLLTLTARCLRQDLKSYECRHNWTETCYTNL